MWLSFVVVPISYSCRNNIFRQTIPYICESVAKRIFSEIVMAAMINYFNEFLLVREYDKIGMLGLSHIIT